MALLAVEHLSFTYPAGAEPVLRDVSFTLEAGDFAVLLGATGSGKSTLLRCLKREIAPRGEMTGKILVDGAPLSALSARESACRIGLVGQRPEEQIVTDKVWHELAFGLENMAAPRDEIRRRTAEIACFFGIEDWFERDTASLSGGQKQLLNLASVMAMRPEALLLDEPTAQLDPIAAGRFLDMLRRLNVELGLTVLLVEHRLEEALPIAGRALALERGRLIACGDTRSVARMLREKPAFLPAMPAAARFAAQLNAAECPLTVGEGRRLLAERHVPGKTLPIAQARTGEAALSLSQVYFRYDRAAADVLRGATLTVCRQEIFCLLGGNGAGKSTLLSCAAGVARPYAGSVRVFGKSVRKYAGQSLYRDCLAMLPQDVQTLFLRDTVAEELADAQADALLLPLDFSPLLDRHPYDLSGGEQQLLALCKALAQRPRLLLLDEPTKGLDAFARLRLTALLRALRERGMTILCVTHDVEFAAVCADRCALLFRGEVLGCDTPRAFFAGNGAYTTAANRMARGICDTAVTVEDLRALCGRETI